MVWWFLGSAFDCDVIAVKGGFVVLLGGFLDYRGGFHLVSGSLEGGRS